MSTREPLRVLHITSSYPRSTTDTAAVFLRHLARSLRQHDVEVDVLAPADQVGGTTLEEGIRVTRFRYLPRRLRRLAYGSGILPNLRRQPALWLAVPFYVASLILAAFILALRRRPDVIHAHWILPQGLIAAFVGRLLRIPFVTTAHGGDAFAFHSGPAARLKRATLRLSNAWTANTLATARAAAGETQNLPPLHVIPMGVDVSRFAAGQRTALRTGLGHDFIILFVGRLVEKKGVDDLIRAFAQFLEQRDRSLRLWIVGEGNYRQALEDLAEDLGVSTQTTFWGQVPNENLPDFYAAADLFVAPSVVAESGDTEGLGVVFLEAFIARVPVVATDVGGIGEIVSDRQTGLLAPPRQPERLAASIALLIHDGQLRSRLVENAFSFASTKYDWRAIAGQFAELYRQLAPGK